MTARLHHTTPQAPAARPTPRTERVLLALARVTRAAARASRRAVLRWQIWETEQWIRACEADGLDVSLSRPDINDQLAALRVQLALLED